MGNNHRHAETERHRQKERDRETDDRQRKREKIIIEVRQQARVCTGYKKDTGEPQNNSEPYTMCI